MRANIKFLCGDYPSNEHVGKLRNQDTCCQLFHAPVESTQHILIECHATKAVRDRLLPELLNVISQIKPDNDLLVPNVPKPILTQFLLDPTGLELPQIIQDFMNYLIYHNIGAMHSLPPE